MPRQAKPKTMTMFPKPVNKEKIEKGQAEDKIDKSVNRELTGRDNTGRFAPGNKNGGRPMIPDDIKEMLRAAVPDAVKLLIDTVNDPTVRKDLRLKAADSLMDRVYGKATQPIDNNITNNTIPQAVADLSVSDLKDIVKLGKTG